jgi:hypothetical protein
MRGLIACALLGLAAVGSMACRSPAPSAATVDVSEATDRAQAHLAASNPEAAESELRAVLKAVPDDAHARAVLARSLHAQGRWSEASVQGRIALGIDPGLWEAAYNLACHSARLGDVDEALHWLQAALSTADVTPAEVAQDEDLARLRGDHRFAFYLATGMLTRKEEDAIARVVPRSVEVGRPATLTVMAITLNQQLMARRDPIHVELVGPLAPDGIAPVIRRETFSTGAVGGREYMQRTIHYGFRPLRPGRLSLGPFKVQLGERTVWTNTPVLDVRPGDGSVHAAVHALTPPTKPGLGDDSSPLTAFFRAPSTSDASLLNALLEAGTEPVELDALGDEEAPEVNWVRLSDREVRAVRFRAIDVDELPASVPPRPAEAQRSVFVQRGSEGWSHVLDVRPLPER